MRSVLRPRFGLRFLLLAVTLACVGLGWWATRPPLSAAAPQQPLVTDAHLEEAPLTFAVSEVGRFAQGHSWYLSVNSGGQAELTIDTFPDRTRTRLQLSDEQLAEFRKALIKARFFELKSEYGQLVWDGSESTITVAAGGHVNTTKVHFLMNWVHNDRARLREPSRAVRLLVMVRGWFDAPEAVDLRRYHKMVLEATPE